MSVRQSTTRKYRKRDALRSALLCTGLAVLGTRSAVADSIAQGTSQAAAGHGTAAEMLKVSAITTKVRERLAARHLMLATVRVNADDREGIVWLTGTVSTVDAAALAGQIAKDTDGVVAVHNAIVVQ